MDDYGFAMALRSYEAKTDNADDAKEEPLKFCDCCGQPLFEGDEVFKIGNDIFGECCCERMWL